MTNAKDGAFKAQFNKNGYEIRTDVLGMAKQFTEFEFSNKIFDFSSVGILQIFFL